MYDMVHGRGSTQGVPQTSDAFSLPIISKDGGLVIFFS